MKLNWLEPIATAWNEQVRQERAPHAALLVGPPGVGKRCAAAWMVRRFLGLAEADSRPAYPLEKPSHADARWLGIAEDKRSIGVEQLRELVREIQLTSYAGGGKAAVLEPANAMTSNAANGLLKTLEEPPGSALLILVADRIGGLPATVLSRCQRMQLGVPPEAESLAWLDQVRPAGNWAAALRIAGHAPLAAIDAHERLADVERMSVDLAAVAERRSPPLEVAGRWAKHDSSFVLDWLAREVQNAIYWTSGAGHRGVGPAPGDSVLKRIDRRNLFCYLDSINRLRTQSPGSFNVQLALESLLIEWAEGLADVARGRRSPLLGVG